MAQQTLNDGVSFGEQRSNINSNFTELYSTKTANSNAAITGGIINGTSIGQTTPAPGSFTTLSASVGIRSGSGAESPTGGVAHCTPPGVEASLEIYQTGVESWKIKNPPGITDLVFANSGSEKLRLSGSGDLSVAGDISSTGKLTTAGIKEDSAGNLGLGVMPSAWAYPYIALQIGLASTLSGRVDDTQVNLSTNWIFSSGISQYISNGFASRYVQDGGGHYWYSAPFGTAGQPISFTQAMTLDASGNLLVGTSTSSGNPLQGFILAPNNGETFSAIGHVSGTPSGGWYEKFSYNGASIGTITQSGTTSVAYNTTSDHRLKENIRPANAGRFNDIKFVDFEWIDGRHDCGVIAHQLQEIYPDLVIGEKDATEIRKVEITPAVPAVTEQKLVSEAIFNEDGEEIEPAVYETIEITPAVEAVFEDQEFPVYQQVNYIGLIGRMGTRIQMLDKLANEQAEVISKLEARLSAIEAKLN